MIFIKQNHIFSNKQSDNNIANLQFFKFALSFYFMQSNSIKYNKKLNNMSCFILFQASNKVRLSLLKCLKKKKHVKLSFFAHVNDFSMFFIFKTVHWKVKKQVLNNDQQRTFALFYAKRNKTNNLFIYKQIHINKCWVFHKHENKKSLFSTTNNHVFKKDNHRFQPWKDFQKQTILSTFKNYSKQWNSTNMFMKSSLKGILLVNFPEKEKAFLIKNLAAQNKMSLITQSASLLLKDSRNINDLFEVEDPIEILFDKIKTSVPCICVRADIYIKN